MALPQLAYRSAALRHGDRRADFAQRVVSQVECAEAHYRIALARAFFQVPRECFIESILEEFALSDYALPIGYRQTISRPSTVAKILAAAELKKGERVLEVGSGCGYMLAMLSCLGARAFGVEMIKPLADAARSRLSSMGAKNILIRCADGYRGWPEHAPFDLIIVSAAVEKIPPLLAAQLSKQGRMLAPLRLSAREQRLTLWRRSATVETLISQDLGPCHFVMLQ